MYKPITVFIIGVFSLAYIPDAFAKYGDFPSPHKTPMTVVFHDKNAKLFWSKALPETYTNGCVRPGGKIDAKLCTFETASTGEHFIGLDTSAAAWACEYSGGRLPTKWEYESLVTQFDHSEIMGRPCLSEKGVLQMQALFGDLPNRFWTMSMWTSRNTSYADVFNAEANHACPSVSGGSRFNSYAVRCVKKAP